MPIETLPPYTEDAPSRDQEPSVFNTAMVYLMNYFVEFVAKLNIWTDQANTLGDEIVDNAAIASSSALIATGVVNSKGAWANLIGTLSIPASVAHTNSTWLLNIDLADVTLSEPTSVNTDWTEISGVTQVELDLKADQATTYTKDEVYNQTEMDKRLNFIPTSKVVAGTATLDITATHTEATTTTTAAYIIGNIIQIEDTGNFYTCIQAVGAGASLTDIAYFTYSTPNILGTDLIIALSNGIDATGAINSKVEKTGITPITPSNGFSAGTNYIKYIQPTDTYESTPDEPKSGQVSATGDYYIDGKWYDKTNTPLPLQTYLDITVDVTSLKIVRLDIKDKVTSYDVFIDKTTAVGYKMYVDNGQIVLEEL